MQDVVDPALHVYILGHVVLDKRKPLVSEEMGDIVHVARDQVVHADDVMSFFDKKIAEVASEEARPAGNQRTLDAGCKTPIVTPSGLF